MDKDISLRDLLEELIGESGNRVEDIDKLVEKLKSLRGKLAKLLKKAPLLIVAAGWSRGDCRRLVSSFPPRYVADLTV